VAIQAGEPPQYSLRYCAPPWLIGFREFGAPFHEFNERPGLTILGAVRTRASIESAIGRGVAARPGSAPRLRRKNAKSSGK
jgi:hypothetical protein